MSTQWFPRRGFLIKTSQKIPKMQFFTSFFEETYSKMIFVNKSEKGEIKGLCFIKIFDEKKKKIKEISKALQNMVIIDIRDTI